LVSGILIFARVLPVIILFFVIIVLLDVEVYGSTMLLSASKTLPQKLLNITSLNITSGNYNTYYLKNNKSGNLGILLFNANDKNSLEKLINSDANSNQQTWLKDFAVPIAAAIIAGVAASWNLFQAKLNGRYFTQLIKDELEELKPIDTNKTDGNLKSHMKKQFIHKKMLDNETENKDLILNTNHKLIYHTKQLWNSFDDNDVVTFLRQLQWISRQPRSKLGGKKYDRNGHIKMNCELWIELVTNDDDLRKIHESKKDITYAWEPEYIKNIFRHKNGSMSQEYIH